MIRITHIIPEAGFELVEKRIGEILFEELTNQKTLQGFDYPINVFVERSMPIDESEKVMINILLDSAPYKDKNQQDTKSDTKYFIDIHTTGIASVTPPVDGWTVSNNALNKFIGMCRYILESTFYKTLGFPAGSLIMGTSVDMFAKADPSNKEDTNFTRMARISFSVRHLESQQMWEGINIFGSDTTVKLGLTELGYKFKFDNTI